MSRISSGFVAVASVAALTAGAGTVGAQSASAAGSTGLVTHYATTKRVCAAPTPGHSTCFAMQRVAATKATPGARAYTQPTALPKGPSGGYTPGDLTTAYGLDSSGGAGQVVGIVDAYDDPTAAADLTAFDEHYSLPDETATSFVKVSQTGSTTSFPASGVSNQRWDIEESLDLDAVRGLCHGCKIILVEATTNTNANLAAAVNEAVTLGATVVSNSYGGPEGTPNSSIDSAYDHSGVPILVSTGDDGWYSWDFANHGDTPANVANTPAALPTVVAVGGTSLHLNADATRASESVWNDFGAADSGGTGDGASGGGCSTEYTAPAWQSSVANYAATGCGTARMTGDISALADPDTGYDVYDSADGGNPWATYGGTSLASPLVAAMWALGGGGHGVTHPAATLYSNFASSPSSLFDVTQGANGACDEAPATCATAWDTAIFGGVQTNPNHSYTGGYYDVDCAFVPNPTGAQNTDITPVANYNQCYAATGYDGPTGVGVPTGTGAFSTGVRITSTAPTGAEVGQIYTPTIASSGSSATPVLSIDPSTTSVCSLSASGTAVDFDHIGSCILDVTQAAGSGFPMSSVAADPIIVSAAPTTTAVAVTPTALVARVAATTSSTLVPQGTVSFSVGGVTVGSAPLSAGVAVLSATVPTGSTRTVAATYGPTGSDFTGSSGSVARQDPTITGRATSAHAKTKYGWYRSAVKVTFTCHATSAALAGGCPAAVTLSKKGAGQSVSRTVSATDGGAATAVVKGINIDLSKPTVKLTGVKSGHTYSTAPTIKVTAKDALSGVASKHTAKKKSTKHGVTTVHYTVTVKDKAGNIKTVKGTYKIA